MKDPLEKRVEAGMSTVCGRGEGFAEAESWVQQHSEWGGGK